MILRRVTTILESVAVALWLGGLISLGTIVAPIVFGVVGWPANADAMTLVFRAFDRVALACAAVILGAEATRTLGRTRWRAPDYLRAGAGVLAGALAVIEAVRISPRIAALHALGAVRGVGAGGKELANLHEIAESFGKIEVILLVAILVLEAVTGSAASAEKTSEKGLPLS